MILGKSGGGIDFGVGYLPLGDITNPWELDINLLLHLSLSPKRLDIHIGGGGGVLFLVGQRYAQPPNELDSRFEPTGSTYWATPFFAQGFIGLKVSPFKGMSFWGDWGHLFFTKITDWSYKKTEQSERLKLNPEWLQYQNLKLGGRCLRVGTSFGL